MKIKMEYILVSAKKLYHNNCKKTNMKLNLDWKMDFFSLPQNFSNPCHI